jgi:hypothetical protein
MNRAPAIIAAVTCLAWATAAVAAPRFPPHPAPTQVQASVTRHGAAATVTALFDQHRWDYVSDRIAAGDAAWLALAAKLAPGTDAGTAEELPIDLAFALPRNAAGVLAAIRDGASDPDDVCSAPFIEDTVKDVPAYRRRAIAAVERVADPRLAAIKAACLAALRKPD